MKKQITQVILCTPTKFSKNYKIFLYCLSTWPQMHNKINCEKPSSPFRFAHLLHAAHFLSVPSRIIQLSFMDNFIKSFKKIQMQSKQNRIEAARRKKQLYYWMVLIILTSAGSLGKWNNEQVFALLHEWSALFQAASIKKTEWKACLTFNSFVIN